MTTEISTDIHFDPADVRHNYHAADEKCHAYGVLKIGRGVTHANLYFEDAAGIDAAIAELVALKQEMDPPAPGCAEVNDGYICNGHDSNGHVAYGPDGKVCHRWPVAEPGYRLACGCTDWCNCDRCRAGQVHDTGTGWHCDTHGRTAVAGLPVTEPVGGAA